MKFWSPKPGHFDRFLYLKMIVVLVALVLCAGIWSWFEHSSATTIHQVVQHP